MAHSKKIYETGKQIASEWFQGAGGKFYEKYDRYDMLRKYARGEHDVSNSKSLITKDQDSSYTNYDFSPVQILPRFKDKLVNEMFPRLFNTEANAVDPYSTDLKNKERDRLMDRLVSKRLDEDMMELFGIDMEAGQSDDRPMSEEEIDMRMSINWKSNIEISSEVLLKYVFSDNKYDETLLDMLNDSVDLGRCGAWVSFNPKKGIIIEGMDPAESIWGYAKKRDHSDSWYFGRRKRTTVGELQGMTDTLYDYDKKEEVILTEDVAKKLKGNISEVRNDAAQAGRNVTSEFDLGEKVDLLYYTYKGIETKHKKKKVNKSGVVSITDYKGEYDGKPTKGFEVITEKKEVWYEGYIVIGTPYCFGSGIVANLAFKSEGNSVRLIPPAVMYANSLYQGKAKGMIERCTTIIDKIQTTEVKIQQLVASAKPSGLRIDVSKINNIKTAGGVMDYKTVMRIHSETGHEIYSSGEGEHGEYSQGNIHELRNGVVQGLMDLVNVQNNYLQQLRDAISQPQGVDASSPHPDTAVKIHEQVSRSANISVSHILDSVLKVTSGVAESTFERVKDAFKYHPDIKKKYIKAVGKINSEIVESMGSLSLSDVGIFITLKPSAQSLLRLEENIQQSLKSKEITLDDAEEVREIGETSIKYAIQMLKSRRIRREKELERLKKQEIELHGEQQVKLAKQQAADAEQRKQIDLTIDQSRIQSQAEAEVAIKREANRLALIEMQKKFEYDYQLEKLRLQGVSQETAFKESEKMRRQDKNNTETSKITEQRINNSPSQDFTGRNIF